METSLDSWRNLFQARRGLRRAGLDSKVARLCIRDAFYARLATWRSVRDLRGLGMVSSKEQRHRVLTMLEILVKALGVDDREVLAAGMFLYVMQSRAGVFLTPRTHGVGRRAAHYVYALAGRGDRDMAAVVALQADRDAYLVCMADQYIRMCRIDDLSEEIAGDLYRNLRDTLVPLRSDTPQVAGLFEAFLVRYAHLASAPFPSLPKQPMPMPTIGTPTLSIDVGIAAGSEAGLENWSTVPHVMAAYIESYKPGAGMFQFTAALQYAETCYGSTMLIESAGRTHIAQAVRRLEVLMNGLKVTNSDVLSAAAVLYLCAGGGLRGYAMSQNIGHADHAERLLAQMGGERMARIADTAYVINGYLPDGTTIRRGTPEYRKWLTALATDVEAVLVVLSDMYAFGELFAKLGTESVQEIYAITKDVLELAKGIDGIDEVFDPWLEKYAPLVQA